MFCKFCNTEMEDDRLYCPECGKRQDQELNKEPKSKEKNKEKKEKKTLSGLVMTVGIVPMVISAVALILVIVLLVMIIVKDSKATPQVPPQTTTATQPETTVTVTPEEYIAAKETVVSALFDDKLTNGLLQMFYTTEINRFLSEYGSGISQFGLDPTKPLSDQAYPYEEAETWEEFFAELALEQWRNCVGLLMLAESEQFAFDPAMQEEMNAYFAILEDIAKENGFENANLMVATNYGAACDLETYKAFRTMNALANEYYYSVIDVTDDEVMAAFPTYKEELAGKEITETSDIAASVRHILLTPEGSTMGEDGKTIATDDAWAACFAEAEAILAEWKAGGATEEKFSALVDKHSEDVKSIPYGGLYEGVSKGSNYVPEFEAWSVDPARQVGDTGIVRTDHGYHIMYFVEGVPEHLYYTKVLLQSDRLEAMGDKLEEFMKDKEATLDYSKVLVQNIYVK